MPKLTFVIGVTATGKSHFIERHYAKADVKIINIYDYQQEAYREAGFEDGVPMGAEFRCLMRANTRLLEDAVKELEQGRDVVVEHTLYKAKRRIAYLDEIRKIPGVTVEIYVMRPGDAQWEKNLEARELGSLEMFEELKDQMEFPNPAEGFDMIYEVVDDEIRERMDPPTPEILEPAREELRVEAERIRAEDEERDRRKALLESMNTRPFWHYCEVCGKKEYITAQEAYDAGWDYPPQMGTFGMLSSRKCGDCTIDHTLWWKVNTTQPIPIVLEGSLTPEELRTWRRIKGEPESLLEEED